MLEDVGEARAAFQRAGARLLLELAAAEPALGSVMSNATTRGWLLSAEAHISGAAAAVSVVAIDPASGRRVLLAELGDSPGPLAVGPNSAH